MSYANQTDLTRRYGLAMLVAATDRGAVPMGVPDADAVASALAAADGVIDAYLGGRYALPLSSVPDQIVTVAMEIAIYKLHAYDCPPKLKDDHDAALRMLRDIADGRVKLNLAGVEAAGTGDTGARITDRERPFTADNMTGYI
jgi:phage gp36-like protein